MHSSSCSSERRPAFGQRYLQSSNDVFDQNAWDDVEWTEDQEQAAKQVVQSQLEGAMTETTKVGYTTTGNEHWNSFYEVHDNKFFKDRHWLFTEFPELRSSNHTGSDGVTASTSAKFTVWEVGCGVGNTVFPLLELNSDPNLLVYCCDYSSNAITIVQKAPTYETSRCKAFVCDISEDFDPPFNENSIDVIVSIFVLSAIMPSNSERRPAFGQRYLQSSNDVFDQNAWDDVEWTEDQEQAAKQVVQSQLEGAMTETTKVGYTTTGNEHWNSFYEVHDNKFFKDRHWLFTEFPELRSSNYAGGDGVTASTSAKFTVWEVGCGVGNTVFPLLELNSDPNLLVYCCDYSSNAITIVQKAPTYETSRCKAFVCDISEDFDPPFNENSIDVIVSIFVLSAIMPSKHKDTIRRIVKYLKPGGILLFRDYGRYDMAQLRFKPARCLGENCYVRGDGTRVFFFESEELNEMMTTCGLQKRQLHVDRRLQVNRSKQLKMYRIWIQAKYEKPIL